MKKCPRPACLANLFSTSKIRLITTKPTLYLVNLSMKDYLRQKNKYLPSIMKWVTEHGGQPSDVIPFSVEFEEKVWSLRNEPSQLAEFYKDIKVKSRISKIVTEGFTKLGLQYYFTGKSLLPPSFRPPPILIFSQPAKKKYAAGWFKEVPLPHKPPASFMETLNAVSLKRKSLLIKIFTISVRVGNHSVLSKRLESLDRRGRLMWFKMGILYISSSMLPLRRRSRWGGE